MRTLAALSLVLCLSAPAMAYGPQVIGPYQPSPFGGYVYFQPAFRNPYSGYVAAPAYRGRYADSDRIEAELLREMREAREARELRQWRYRGH
jgi:hypothetical protein